MPHIFRQRKSPRLNIRLRAATEKYEKTTFLFVYMHDREPKRTKMPIALRKCRKNLFVRCCNPNSASLRFTSKLNFVRKQLFSRFGANHRKTKRVNIVCVGFLCVLFARLINILLKEHFFSLLLFRFTLTLYFHFAKRDCNILQQTNTILFFRAFLLAKRCGKCIII